MIQGEERSVTYGRETDSLTIASCTVRFHRHEGDVLRKGGRRPALSMHREIDGERNASRRGRVAGGCQLGWDRIEWGEAGNSFGQFGFHCQQFLQPSLMDT